MSVLQHFNRVEETDKTFVNIGYLSSSDKTGCTLKSVHRKTRVIFSLKVFFLKKKAAKHAYVGRL